jgi:methionyl-tRNA formyltransferase
MTICIAGKSEIAVKALSRLMDVVHDEKIIACLNRDDKGIDDWRPSFARACRNNSIDIVTLDTCYGIENLIFISLKFDKLIRPDLFCSPHLLNLHFSLLPAYKGMHTGTMPILRGEHSSGVTLHIIDDGIDTGPIIDQMRIDIGDNTSARELYSLYMENGFNLFERNLKKIVSRNYVGIPQSAKGASYFSKHSLDFHNIKIDLNKTAWEVHNQIRAFSFREYQLPKVGGIQIYKSEILPLRSVGKPGTVVAVSDEYVEYNTIDFIVRAYIDKVK